MTTSQAVTAAARRFREAGIDSPLLDAQLIAAHVLRCSRVDVIAHPEQEMKDRESAEFLGLVEKRVSRYPLAYIVGHREFYGIDIIVERGVLTPRPETETLVEECLKRLRAVPHPVIADIGAGSGAIAVALSVNLPEGKVYATEISDVALKVAQRNIEKQMLFGRVTALLGDLLEPLSGIELDAIVSNPPYIASDAIPLLQPEIALYEPREALDGGPDGLDVYRRLFTAAPGLLKPGGFCAVEIGAGQCEAVMQQASCSGFERTEVVRDLARADRVVIAYR